MEFDSAKVIRCNRAYRRWTADIPEESYQYESDICYCLAHLIAVQAKQDGFPAYKICATSSKRNGHFTNYVSVNLRNAETGAFEEIQYDYHIAAAIEASVYKDSRQTELLVADPILFGRDLVTLKQWKQATACPDYDFHIAPLGQPLLASPSGYNIMKGDPPDLTADARRQIDNARRNIHRCRNLAAIGWKKYMPKKYTPLVSMLMRTLRMKEKQKSPPSPQR